MTQLTIRFLADRPDAVTAVAGWAHSEWGRSLGVSLKQMEAGFRRRCHRDRIPFTLVGELDGRTVGTSTVVQCDMPSRRELRPWLAAVFVDPQYRGRGFGSALVQAACDHAASLGVRRIYLYTANRVPFYVRLGWATLETRRYCGEEVVVMSRDLGAASAIEP